MVFTEAALTTGNVLRVVATIGAFCLLSSAVYVVNDMFDASSDRLHPRKCRRPIAAKLISAPQATVAALLLVSIAAGIAIWLPIGVLILCGLYLANSLLYSLLLKHKVIVDVLTIAIGFVLRLLAGCVAINVSPSSWLVVCGFSVALVLGFGKRRTEIQGLANDKGFRDVLQTYTAAKLDTLLGITCCMSLVSYMLFAVAPETIARHGTTHLIYTVPFVAYGIFRYLFKVQEGKGDGPTDILTRDPIFFVNGALWAVSVLLVLHVFR